MTDGQSTAATPADPSQIWRELDAVIVINLKSRPDRWEIFQKRVGSMFPPGKVHRLEAVVGKELPGYGKLPWFSEQTGERASSWAGVAGCALSHRKAIESVLENGWQRVLICEDDIEPASTDILPDIPELFRAVPEPSYLYLGYHMRDPRGRLLRRTAHGELWKVEGVLACHSYVVSAETCRRLLPHLPDSDNIWEWVARNRAIDNFCRDRMYGKAGVSSCVAWPVLFRQQTLGSDIDTSRRVRSTDSKTGHPRSLRSLSGILHLITRPWRRLKVRMNSWHTHRRALRNGFPGYKR
ncbi:MAG TPA: glycosyltransferase family 25 protein [Candidatus Akkermansia intestinigallinarum]|uniref:Glycosyltransferase family 25 protein n=1 Tax=Candidatus Akkermansia intestinigallinarum TaxID=2838431 RepID=A0A9D2AI08_9BACT|nr:glycosyltransferase family 25 protein [Candidatus Akkermansia intestinigallinarum]